MAEALQEVTSWGWLLPALSLVRVPCLATPSLTLSSARGDTLRGNISPTTVHSLLARAGSKAPCYTQQICDSGDEVGIVTPFTWFGGKDTGLQPGLAGSVPTPNSPKLQTSLSHL